MCTSVSWKTRHLAPYVFLDHLNGSLTPALEQNGKATSSGIKGKFRKSGDPGPNVTKSRSGGGRSGAKRRSEDPRARSVSRNLREAAASRARRERKEAFSAPYGGIASRPPANPKEGDMYKRPFGPVMVYKDGRFIRKKYRKNQK